MTAGSKSQSRKRSSSTRFVVGAERFDRISAVEGIALTAAMKRRAASFDKLGLTAAERRRKIIEVYQKSSSADV